MKTSILNLLLGIGCVTTQVALGAAFQNLDFESPLLPLVPDPSDPYGRVPAANAMAGWTAYVGSDIEPLAGYNASFLSSAGISLLGPGQWLGDGFTVPSNLIAGSYSALIKGGTPLGHPGQPEPASASLAQSGLVAAGTHSLFLSVDTPNAFFVTLGGQPLDLVPMQQAANYVVYGADVTAFEGQIAELRISTAATGANYGYLWLDSISFSPTPVPEPGRVALAAVAIMAIGLARGIRRSRP